MRTKLFGMGAAGNKAAILAVENNIISKENVVLINSTLTDIPVAYEGMKYELPGNVGGTGKDRKISKKQSKVAIEKKGIDLDKILIGNGKEQKVDQVIFVTSADGGSGSGSTVEFANYIYDVMRIPVMVFAFIGRTKDIKGLRNTVEFFKDLTKKATIQIIMNESFAEDESDGNDSRIEAEANSVFCNKLSVVLGNIIDRESAEQNLDERELVKIRTTPGYMVVESLISDQKIKNTEQVRKAVTDLFDNSKSPEPDKPDMARLGIIYNSEKEESQYLNILPVIKEKFGMPFEVFTHRQYVEKEPRHISVIMAGLVMPLDYINSIYESYVANTSKINKEEDIFAETMKQMDFEDDSAFEDDVEFDI